LRVFRSANANKDNHAAANADETGEVERVETEIHLHDAKYIGNRRGRQE